MGIISRQKHRKLRMFQLAQIFVIVLKVLEIFVEIRLAVFLKEYIVKQVQKQNDICIFLKHFDHTPVSYTHLTLPTICSV